MLDDSFSFMSQYPNPDQSGGLFGGGFYTTFNGFGSLNAILNVICSFFIMIMLLLESLSRKTLRYLFIFLIILLFITLIEIIIAPFLLSDPVRLKSGFYILRIMEVALFYVAYVNVKKLDKTEIEKVDLIDN
jgi:uncharacterized membrane protein